MDSLDHQTFQQVSQWLETDESCWLCTILATVGATPRPPGALLACTQTELVGSISGGCIEDDLLQRLRSGELQITQPQIIEYGVTSEQNERLGLPCGGRLRVLIELWSPEQKLQQELQQLWSLIQQRRIAQRKLNLQSGAWSIREVLEFSPLQFSAESLRQCYGPRYQMLLIGAGETARALAAMAMMLDYRVLICDPRADRIAQWQLDGVELLRCMPDDAVRDYCSNDIHSIVITLTHDPRIDDMALMEALQHELFYIGALGSERTSAKRRERLQQLDISQQQLARLHAPVGLRIGSKRPPEIAVAILAELTQLRSKRPKMY